MCHCPGKEHPWHHLKPSQDHRGGNNSYTKLRMSSKEINHLCFLQGGSNQSNHAEMSWNGFYSFFISMHFTAHWERHNKTEMNHYNNIIQESKDGYDMTERIAGLVVCTGKGHIKH